MNECINKKKGERGRYEEKNGGELKRKIKERVKGMVEPMKETNEQNKKNLVLPRLQTKKKKK